MPRHRSLKLSSVFFVGLVVLNLLAGSWFTPSSAASADGIWQDVAEKSAPDATNRRITPRMYRYIALNQAALQQVLAQAPLEGSRAARRNAVVLPLPLPDGTFARFKLLESPIMEPQLAAQFPAIKTYVGQGLDDPTLSGRFDWTPGGFHALILSSAGRIFIDPYSGDDTIHYMSYYSKDFTASAEKALSWDMNDDVITTTAPAASAVRGVAGTTLRTYRLAMAATGEYTQFHGGTVSGAFAAIVTSVNRVDAIYEQEVALRLILVNNTTQVIYTDPTTDPYSNESGGVMLAENQSTLDRVLGSANYDIGHVFSTGGGGVADLEAVCSAQKAYGVTGSSQPVGDPFDVDYVSHEIGHQFGANHTFNGTTGFCGGARSSFSAYEPGSGSTIMGYAGICDAENLQSNSDAYFHGNSFDEIMNFTTAGKGNMCAATSSTGNNPPSVVAGPSYVLPKQTPFTLTGSASDPDGDALTYSWEQFNLGNASTASSINVDDGTRPLFRSFPPSSSPSRTFPQLSSILNNATPPGEVLPATNRVLRFRLTARDHRVGGGGVNSSIVDIPVTTSAGPFVVVTPTTLATWTAATTQTVTWEVANTQLPPVNCAAVDIYLSADGGLNFSSALATSTPNDGSEPVFVGNTPTNQARIKVMCANNMFFAINNGQFIIQSSAAFSAQVYLPLIER